MTPTLPEILRGEAIAMSTLLPPEAGGDYAAGRTGMLASLAMLASQEAERGPAARVWENGAMRGMLGQAAGVYDAGLGGVKSQRLAHISVHFLHVHLFCAGDSAGQDAGTVEQFIEHEDHRLISGFQDTGNQPAHIALEHIIVEPFVPRLLLQEDEAVTAGPRGLHARRTVVKLRHD